MRSVSGRDVLLIRLSARVAMDFVKENAALRDVPGGEVNRGDLSFVH